VALKVDYVVRETSGNLFRNFTITLATVVTVAVSLALVGAGMMLRNGVSNATERWEGGIEFVIFMNPDASTDTPEQIDAMRKELEANPGVESFKYVDQEGAYNEFKKLFADSPDLIATVSPEILPSSFRVVPVEKDANAIEDLADQFKDKAGVKEVALASETIQVIQSFTGRLSTIVVIVAMILLAAAALLIFNTIRMAMFARRREIEVMKLVGATNWFIRVPFMLEGLIQGVAGALLAIGGLAVFKPFFEDMLDPEQIPLVSGFVVTSSEALLIYTALAIVGCLVGAAGAGIAVTRFLDV
jgi:cell division transport system permease protein